MKAFATLFCLTLLTSSALGGEFSILSMHHSSDHFVPHLRFDGVIQTGDAEYLTDMLENMPRCRQSCEGATAVLSLDSAGGNYIEAMAMAALLRRERVATVVGAEAVCFSACLAAFIGGTGYGAGPDRIVVPGARIMLYPFETQHEGLAHAILNKGLEAVLGAPLAQLQAMAQEETLGIPLLLSDLLVPTGSVLLRDLSSPTNLSLLGATLPPANIDELMPDRRAGLLQACAHGMSAYYAAKGMDLVVEDAAYNIDPAFQRDLGSIGMNGYRIEDSQVTFCVGDIEARDEHHVWMFGPGAESTEELLALPVKPHMVFPVSDPTFGLEEFYRPFVKAWTFNESAFVPSFPALVDADLDWELGVKPLLRTLTSRISTYGELLIFEQVGDESLTQGLAAYLKSPALVDQQIEGGRMVSFVKARHADSGNAVLIAAIGGRYDNWIGRIEADRPWDRLSEDELNVMKRWGCNVEAVGEQISCD